MKLLLDKNDLLLACQSLKQALWVDVTLMAWVAPIDYFAATAVVSLAEEIYGPDSKTFGKYKSFTYQNILMRVLVLKYQAVDSFLK